MKRYVESHMGGYILHKNESENEFYQTDWNWPALATIMGWSVLRVQRRGKKIVHLTRVMLDSRARHDPDSYCRHLTDGTVKCNLCGITASDFIRCAGEYLDRIAR
jgi:hypothetical protein